MYKIKSPVAGYNGQSAGIQFRDGEGQTDNAWVADRLKKRGYAVTEEKPAKQDKTDKQNQGGKKAEDDKNNDKQPDKAVQNDDAQKDGANDSNGDPAPDAAADAEQKAAGKGGLFGRRGS